MEKGMRTPDIEGVATHDGPESCAGVRKGVGEALTGVRAGGAIEPRNQCFGVPTRLTCAEGQGRKPSMHDGGESDSPVVPAKLPNKTGRPVAEAVEERGLAEGNMASKTRPGRSAGTDAPSALDRVRRVAQRDKQARFTALLHHVDVDRLRAAYRAIRPDAAPGVDGETWRSYGQQLEERLHDLHGRLQRGAYRAKPTRRAYIPKADVVNTNAGGRSS